MVGLSPFGVNARLADAAAGVNATTDLADRLPTYTDLPTYTNIDGNVPTHLSFNADERKYVGKPEVEVISTPTATAKRMSAQSILDIWYDGFLVIYFIVWVKFILPELGRKMRRPETDEILDTPLLKIFTLACVIIGAIFGFLTGYNIPLQPGEDPSVHIMGGILYSLGGAIFGVFAIIDPFIIAAVLAFFVVVGSAGLGWIWIKGLFNGLINRR